MSTPKPFSVHLAQFLAIGLTTSAAGAELALSTFLIPRLLESPTPVLLRQMSHHIFAGRVIFPPLTAAAAACYYFLAYRFMPAAAEGGGRVIGGSAGGGKAVAFLAAGLLAQLVAPYTWRLVLPINGKVVKRAQDAGVLETYVVDGAQAAGPKPPSDELSPEDQLDAQQRAVEERVVAGAAKVKGILQVLVDETGPEEETTHYLVEEWGVLNLGRAMLLGLSGAIGIWTSL